MKTGRRLLLDCRDCQIQLLLEQEVLELGRVSLAQGDFQVGEAFADVLEDFRQMFAQHDGGGADADLARLAALQFAGDEIEVGEEGLDELIELLTGWRE